MSRSHRVDRVFVGFTLLWSLAACTGAVSEGPGPETLAGSTDASEAPPMEAEVATEESRPNAEHDPWEGMNRKVFWFNDRVDVYVLEPAAKGWDFVVPDPAQTSISNFFDNLRFPIYFVNDVFQGKPGPAASDVGRFLVNSTIGVAGFFDPAESLGMERKVEDFGQTLAVWGVPAGPYLVLPLLGPSNPRDTAGLIGDYPLAITPFFVDQYILLGARAVDIVNERSLFLEEVQQVKEASFDYYVFVRNAYAQRRRALIEDGEVTPAEQDEEDLYFFDDEEE